MRNYAEYVLDWKGPLTSQQQTASDAFVQLMLAAGWGIPSYVRIYQDKVCVRTDVGMLWGEAFMYAPPMDGMVWNAYRWGHEAPADDLFLATPAAALLRADMNAHLT